MHDHAAAGEVTAVAAAAEYRHFGDDSALLTVVVQAHGAALPGEATLEVPGGEPVRASAVTFQPGAGLARLVFAVDRGVASAAGTALRVSLGPELRIRVPEPVKRPAIGVPDGETDHAVAAGVAGDELAGLIRMLERRATIAERVASDAREHRSDATKLAQAYREIWEVRELLESREEAYRRSTEAVDAVQAAQRAAEEQAAAARTELEDVRAEAQVAAERLEDELAARRAEIDGLVAAHAAAVERLTADHAAAVERLEADLEARTERLEAKLAAAQARSAELEAERDEALAAATRLEGDIEAALGVAEEARAARDDALSQVEEIKRDLAQASANVASWSAELEQARTRAADAEALLEAERTLHEARLAARAGSERRLADLFAEAQRERLRQTPLDEQQAQVDALERQLARLKQPRPDTSG